jgi:hypothetical protein
LVLEESMSLITTALGLKTGIAAGNDCSCSCSEFGYSIATMQKGKKDLGFINHYHKRCRCSLHHLKKKIILN